MITEENELQPKRVVQEFRPYDLTVIKMSKHNKDINLPEYYTISAHGIVHVYNY